MSKIRYLLALISVVSISVLTAGGTLALLTSRTNSPDAEYSSSALVITSDRDDGDTFPGPMFYVTPAQGQTPSGVDGAYPTGLWAPGDSKERTIIVKNHAANGSTMDAWLDSVQASLQAGSYAPLADKLNVVISSRDSQGLKRVVARGTLSQFVNGPVALAFPDSSRVPSNLDSDRYLFFELTFDSSADNTYQGKTLVADFSVTAVQKRNNP